WCEGKASETKSPRRADRRGLSTWCSCAARYVMRSPADLREGGSTWTSRRDSGSRTRFGDCSTPADVPSTRSSHVPVQRDGCGLRREPRAPEPLFVRWFLRARERRLDRCSEAFRAFVHLVGRHDERRHEAERVAAGGVEEDAVIQSGGDEVGRLPALAHGKAEHESEPARRVEHLG